MCKLPNGQIWQLHLRMTLLFSFSSSRSVKCESVAVAAMMMMSVGWSVGRSHVTTKPLRQREQREIEEDSGVVRLRSWMHCLQVLPLLIK